MIEREMIKQGNFFITENGETLYKIHTVEQRPLGYHDPRDFREVWENKKNYSFYEKSRIQYGKRIIDATCRDVVTIERVQLDKENDKVRSDKETVGLQIGYPFGIDMIVERLNNHHAKLATVDEVKDFIDSAVGIERKCCDIIEKGLMAWKSDEQCLCSIQHLLFGFPRQSGGGGF